MTDTTRKQDKYDAARERLRDWNLGSAFEYNQCDIDIDDIESVMAVHEGERDGGNWVWLVKFTTGKVALIEAGCDYTGWDCRSSIDVCEVFNTINEALGSVNIERSVCEEFKEQVLNGKSVSFRDKGI